MKKNNVLVLINQVQKFHNNIILLQQRIVSTIAPFCNINVSRWEVSK